MTDYDLSNAKGRIVLTMHIYCPQYFATFGIEGSNGQNWMVKTDGPHMTFCSCPAYRYSGDWASQTCKHIALVKKQGCFWNSDKPSVVWDEPAFLKNKIELLSTKNDSVHGPNLRHPCPGCGEPVISRPD